MEILRIRHQIITLMDEILSRKNDTLIVSHGALMHLIEKELVRGALREKKLEITKME